MPLHVGECDESRVKLSRPCHDQGGRSEAKGDDGLVGLPEDRQAVYRLQKLYFWGGGGRGNGRRDLHPPLNVTHEPKGKGSRSSCRAVQGDPRLFTALGPASPFGHRRISFTF